MTTETTSPTLTDLHPSGVPCVTLRGEWGGFVWQNVDRRFANAATRTLPRLQKRRKPVATDPNSIEQYLVRDLFRRSQQQWKSLGERTQNDLRRVAGRFGYQTGYGLFIGGNMAFFSAVLPFIVRGGKRTQGKS